jgi:hypothetical protein
MSSPTSPEDIVNQALVRLGFDRRIGNLFEGSPAAEAALEVYSQTRDEALRANDYGFAERNLSLSVLKVAPANGYIPPTVWSPAYPPIPWMFEYSYPGDCLKVRSIKAAPLWIPNFDPQPNSFAVINDTSYSPAQKTICCNVTGAILTYTGQVTDMSTWEPLFVEVLVAKLAERLSPRIAILTQERLAEQKLDADLALRSTVEATSERG